MAARLVADNASRRDTTKGLNNGTQEAHGAYLLSSVTVT